MSGSSQYITASDGLPARVSGPWAEEKLEYLGKYGAIFNVGMKDRFRHRVFLDLMAGSGRCILASGAYEFLGSPLVALACDEPFTRVVLVEDSPELVAALRTRVGDRADVIEGDCNDRAVIARLREALPSESLGLAFVDNLGLDVTFDTLCDLTNGKRVDLFITFQIGDLKRNLEAAREGRDDARWTAFFGDDGWRAVVAAAVAKNASAEDTVTQLLEYYGQRLGTIGYHYIAHAKRVMKNSTNVGLYRMVLAGKHERARDFFEKISKIQPGGQRGLDL